MFQEDWNLVQPPSGDRLAIDDAAEYLGIKPRYLRGLVQRQAIPHYRVGRLIRFERDDLDAFLRAHRVAVGS